MTADNTIIIKADKTNLDRGAEVLSEAFLEEPLTAFIFDFSRKNAPAVFRRMYSLAARIYFESQQEIFLAVEGDAVKGIAALTKEGKIPVLKAAARNLPGILSLLPEALSIISFKKTFAVRKAVAVPRNLPRPCFSLEAIAVDSRYRGTGIGGMLLDEVGRSAGKAPLIKGVYLITLTEKNRRLYERYGYKLIEERRVNGLNVRHMFRENRAGS